MSNPSESYRDLIAEVKELAVLESIDALLGWDERTYMPGGGAELRATQTSLLARRIHEQFTSPRIGDLLAGAEGGDLAADPESDAAVNLREIRRSFDRARKLPGRLVEELARTQVLSEQAWATARQQSDFPAFRPWLEKILHLKQEQARCLRDGKNLYDALLDDYEPGETAQNLRRVFDGLAAQLGELVGKIAASGRKAPERILHRFYAEAAQKRLSLQAAAAVGFDFTCGRLDETVHPFSTGIGPGDTRITTRYNERFFPEAFFGTLHETGHGLYSQGLPREHFGTPRGNHISLGIHESQSRMWENLVGRSRSFWKFFFPMARESFGSTLADVTGEQWHFAINAVQPSLIRIEADETTYNLHVLLRFELEQALIAGQLSPADLPGAWNAKMKEYLGMSVPDDASGCLQDVHWSGGMIGYFPTYALGNLYAAQFFQQARRDLDDMDGQFARGDFAPLVQWLRKNIHQQGMKYSAGQLVKRITGRELSAGPLLEHLRQNAEELYLR